MKGILLWQCRESRKNRRFFIPAAPPSGRGFMRDSFMSEVPRFKAQLHSLSRLETDQLIYDIVLHRPDVSRDN